MMDEIDRQILASLNMNARLPLKTIAATVGMARSSVRDRIAKLENAGIIQGYQARIKHAEDVSAVLHIRLDRTPSPATVALIVAMAEVRRCYSLSGEIDLMVELGTASTASLNNARDRIACFPDVTEVITALILNRDKDC